MTEAAASAVRVEIEHVQTWSQSFASVLGQIAGSPIPCAVLTESPAELASQSSNDLWILCACSGGLRGELSLRIPPAGALRLAQIFMSEPATPGAELTPEYREAAVELLRQVAGLVASALKARWGEVPLRLDPAIGAPSWPASVTAWVRAGEDPATAPLIEVLLSAALTAALRTEKESPKPAASTPAPPPPSPQEDNGKLSLLLDVELAITLRFGGRKLLLREVLDLNSGSVVDLDRQVQEPVDVLLDGRVVARGEIVVVDGNYGLRVTEVAPGAN